MNELTAVVQTVLAAVLASTAAVAVVAFLGRSLVRHWLDKDIDKFRIELTANLKRAATEHQVSFTRLHEKRTYVIATIYAELERLHASLREWGTIGSILPDKAAAALTFRAPVTAARDKLVAFYYPRAIWLERDMCDRLNQIIDTLNTLVGILDLEAKGIPITFQGEGSVEQLKAELLQHVGDARAELEIIFRRTLGMAGTQA